MGYRLGRHSKSELRGVHPDLVAVVEMAIQITKQDFTVHDGIRTEEEQRELYNRGASFTMKSKHLKQEDGFGHAVDLVAYINGKLRWELEPHFEIAIAMRVAAEELGVKLRWGGCWQRLDRDSRSPALMVEEYVSKRRRQGRSSFVDAFHFELLS